MGQPQATGGQEQPIPSQPEVVVQELSQDSILVASEFYEANEVSREDEVPALRDEFSYTFAKEDGSYVAFITPEATNYKDPDGLLRPIDNSVVESESAEHPDHAFENTTNAQRSFFPKDAGGTVVVEHSGDTGSVILHEEPGIAWIADGIGRYPVGGRKSSLPVASGNSVTYDDVYYGASERFSVSGATIKHELILEYPLESSGGGAYLALSEIVTLPEGASLSSVNPAIDGPNGTSYLDLVVLDADGNEIGSFPRPVAIAEGVKKPADKSDASGAGNKGRDESESRTAVGPPPLTQSFGRASRGFFRAEMLSPGRYRIDTCFDGEWLASGDIVYPVSLDPTYYASATNSNGDVNYYYLNIYRSSAFFTVGATDYWDCDDFYDGYTEFNTTSILDGSTISALSLSFYVEYDYAVQNDIYITPMSTKPSTNNSGLSLSDDINDGTAYYGLASIASTGWRTWTMPAAARTDMANLLASNWFAFGFRSYDVYYCDDYCNISGWGDGTRSYITATYTYGGAHVWIGGTSTAWATAANWSTGTVPGAGNDVVIPGGCTYYPSFTSGTANCNRLTLFSGASISVAGGTLTCANDLVINSGSSVSVTSGTLNVNGASGAYWSYNGIDCFGTFTASGGTVSVAQTFELGGGTATFSGATATFGGYLYNVRGYNSTINVSAGSVTCANIPNYQGTINHSGGTIYDNGYYYEQYTDGGIYYGSGSATIQFQGGATSYIDIERTETYFRNMNVTGSYSYGNMGGATNSQDLDINGNLSVTGTLGMDKDVNIDLEGNGTVSGTFNWSGAGNLYLYCGGNWNSSGGSVTYDTYFIMDGGTGKTLTSGGAKHFLYLYVEKSAAANTVTLNGGVRCDHLIHTRGTLVFNSADDVFVADGVYYGYGGAVLQMSNGDLQVKWSSAGSYGPWHANGSDGYGSGWSENITGGTISIYAYGVHATYRTAMFEAGSNFTPTGGTFRFLDAATTAQTVYLKIAEPTNFNFYNLTIDNYRTVYLENSAGEVCDINGSFTINAGGTFLSQGISMEVAGGWTNSGTYTHGNSIVYFDGTGSQSISAGGTGVSKAFYRVYVTGAGTCTMTSSMQVDQSFFVQGGTFAINNYSLYTLNSLTGSATISVGAEVDLTGASSYWRPSAANNGTLTISGTLDLNAGAVSTDAAMVLAAGGVVNQDGGTLGVGDNFTINGDYNGNAGTLRGRSDGDASTPQITINVAGTYCYDFFSDGGTTGTPTTLNGTQSLTVLNSVSIPSGDELSMNGVALLVGGNWTNAGTFTHGSNIVTFNGTGTQTIIAGGTGAGYRFYDVYVSNAGTTQLGGNLEVERNFQVQGGIFAVNNYSLYTLNVAAGSASISAGAEVDMTGASSYWRAADQNNGTLTISGTLDLNAGNFTTDSSVTLAAGGVVNQDGGTIGVGDNLTINGDFNGNAGTLRGRSDGEGVSPQIIVNVAGTYCYDFFTDGGDTGTPTAMSGSQPLTVLHDVSIPAGDELSAGSVTIYVAGNWTNNGTFTEGTSTIDFNGSSSSALSGTLNFYNLIMSKSSTSYDVTPGATMTVGNNFAISGGNLANGSYTHVIGGNCTKSGGRITMTLAACALDIAGNFTNSAGDVSISGGGRLLVAGNVAISGNNSFVPSDVRLHMDGSGTQTISMSGTNNKIANYLYSSSGGTVQATSALSIYHLIHTTGGFDVNGQTITTDGVYYGYSGATLTMASGTMNIGQNGYGGGTYSPWYCASGWSENISGGTVNLRGASHATYGNAGFDSGCNFTPTGGTFNLIGNDATKEIWVGEATNFNFYNLGMGDGTNATNVTLRNVGGQQALDVNGTLTINANATFTSNSKPVEVAVNWTNGGTFAQGTGMVTFDGSAAQVIGGSTTTTFYDLIVNNTAGSPSDSVDVDPSGAVNATGTLTVNDGQFSPATGSAFANVTVNAAGILKPDASATINVTGGWTNNGTFTHNSGTVNFSGSSNQTISGSGGLAFGGISVNNTGDPASVYVQPSGAHSMTSLTVSDGWFDCAGQTCTITGNVSVAASQRWSLSTVAGATNLVTVGGNVTNSGTLDAGDVGTVNQTTALDVAGNFTSTGTVNVTDRWMMCAGNWATSGTYNGSGAQIHLDAASGTTTISHSAGGTGLGTIVPRGDTAAPASITRVVQLATNVTAAGLHIGWGSDGAVLDLNNNTFSTSASVTIHWGRIVLDQASDVLSSVGMTVGNWNYSVNSANGSQFVQSNGTFTSTGNVAVVVSGNTTAATMTISGGTFNINGNLANIMLVYGTLNVSGGTLNVGRAATDSTSDIQIARSPYNTAGAANFSGGTVSVVDQVKVWNASTFSMSGTAVLNAGSFTGANAGSAGPKFGLNSGCTFNMTGGTLNVQRENFSGGQPSFYLDSASTTSITGGVIKFANSSTNNVPTKFTTGGKTLYRVEIDMTSSAYTVTPYTNAVALSENLNVTTGIYSGNALNTTVGGDLSVGALGTLNVAGETVTVSGGTSIVTGGTVALSSGAMSLSGDFSNSGTFTHSAGTLTFPGTTNVNGSTSTSFGDATITGSVTMSGATSATFANITLTGGTLAAASKTINVSGDISESGTTTISATTGTINLAGASGIPSGTNTVSLGATSTVNHNRAGAQALGAFTYGNLTLSGSGAKTPGGNVVAAGNLNVGAGTSFPFGANQSLTVGGTATVSGDLSMAGTSGNPAMLLKSGGGSLSLALGSAASLTLSSATNGTGAGNATSYAISGGGANASVTVSDVAFDYFQSGMTAYLDFQTGFTGSEIDVQNPYFGNSSNTVGARNVKVASAGSPLVLVFGGGGRIYGEEYDIDANKRVRFYANSPEYTNATTGATYGSLSAAISAATAGDVIRGSSGVPCFGDFTIDKQLILEEILVVGNLSCSVNTVTIRNSFVSGNVGSVGGEFRYVYHCSVDGDIHATGAAGDGAANYNLLTGTITLASGATKNQNLESVMASTYWVNATIYDFHLKSTAAAAIDQATASSEARDFDGQTRSTVDTDPDIGADERISTNLGGVIWEIDNVGPISYSYISFAGDNLYWVATAASDGVGDWSNSLVALDSGTGAVVAGIRGSGTNSGFANSLLTFSGSVSYINVMRVASGKYDLYIIYDSDDDGRSDRLSKITVPYSGTLSPSNRPTWASASVEWTFDVSEGPISGPTFNFVSSGIFDVYFIADSNASGSDTPYANGLPALYRIDNNPASGTYGDVVDSDQRAGTPHYNYQYAVSIFVPGELICALKPNAAIDYDVVRINASTLATLAEHNVGVNGIAASPTPGNLGTSEMWILGGDDTFYRVDMSGPANDSPFDPFDIGAGIAAVDNASTIEAPPRTMSNTNWIFGGYSESGRSYLFKVNHTSGGTDNDWIAAASARDAQMMTGSVLSSGIWYDRLNSHVWAVTDEGYLYAFYCPNVAAANGDDGNVRAGYPVRISDANVRYVKWGFSAPVPVLYLSLESGRTLAIRIK
ncbi:MAG: hypothetical protein NUW37_04675 [Planctomycetes bacterium]|nr:hypothetical protein [Planctomycetota bacterium]